MTTILSQKDFRNSGALENIIGNLKYNNLTILTWNQPDQSPYGIQQQISGNNQYEMIADSNMV